MNKRIKEFAEKTLSKDQFGLWLAGDDDIKKFANLIVRNAPMYCMTMSCGAVM